MSTKPSRAFCSTFDALERREVLSHISPFRVIPRFHVYPVHGTGNAQVINYAAQSNGSTLAAGYVVGNSIPFGTFTGTAVGAVSSNVRYIDLNAHLTATNGSTVDLGIYGPIRGLRGRIVPTTISGPLHFTVTGGTGEFAGAVGGGVVRATANLANLSAYFTFNGRVRI